MFLVTYFLPNMILSLFLVMCCVASTVKCQINLEEHFKNCRMDSLDFDDCIKDGINNLRPLFKEGLPEYGINPFDPFHISKIYHKGRFPLANYRLILKNVTESGWTASQVTKFRTDLSKNQVQVTQFFPDKRLDGWYEIEGTFLGQKVHNQGSWNLSLFDYVQTLTISMKLVKNSQGYEVEKPEIKVKCNIQSCKKLELHIGHLAGGRTIVENMLDWIINSAWQPGFVVLSPIINELVGTAFSEILNKDFQDFPFEEVFNT